MSDTEIVFDHIHIISEDPTSTANWYVEVLGGKITGNSEVRGAPQISVAFQGVNLLVRGQRPGEQPDRPNSLQHYADYISHNEWGTDHFGFNVLGNLDDYCDQLKKKGATFSVEPYDFVPGARIAYLEAPDGVSIELVQARK
ncbi:MAG: VOC family protein [Desulfobacterales bacterium]